MMRVTCRATSAGDSARVAPSATSVFDRPLAAAVNDERDSRFQKVVRHRAAHETESDEADCLRHAREYSSTMFIVLVHVQVEPEFLGEFEPAILNNAARSVERDPGCFRFDVLQQEDDPAKWVFYEVLRERARVGPASGLGAFPRVQGGRRPGADLARCDEADRDQRPAVIATHGVRTTPQARFQGAGAVATFSYPVASKGVIATGPACAQFKLCLIMRLREVLRAINR